MEKPRASECGVVWNVTPPHPIPHHLTSHQPRGRSKVGAPMEPSIFLIQSVLSLRKLKEVSRLPSSNYTYLCLTQHSHLN